MRELRHAEFNLHIASVRDFLRILNRFLRIRKKKAHLLLTLNVILSACIHQTVLVLHGLTGLDAKKQLVRLGVRCISVVNVIGGHKRDIHFLADGKKCRVNGPLFRQSMVLKLEEIIALAEAVKVLLSAGSCLSHHTFKYVSRKLARDTGRKGDNALMIFIENLEIHSGPVIIAFRESDTYNLTKVSIADIILGKKYKVVITLLTASDFFVKTGVRRNVYLTAEDRLNAFFSGRLVIIDAAVHNAVVGDGPGGHAQFFEAFHVFFYLIGTVQKRKFRVDVKMYKRHVLKKPSPLFLRVIISHNRSR
jgi:hypothetical protein